MIKIVKKKTTSRVFDGRRAKLPYSVSHVFKTQWIVIGSSFDFLHVQTKKEYYATCSDASYDFLHVLRLPAWTKKEYNTTCSDADASYDPQHVH
jgi:hypothetical protein